MLQKKFLKNIVEGSPETTDDKFFTELGKIYIDECAEAMGGDESSIYLSHATFIDFLEHNNRY